MKETVLRFLYSLAGRVADNRFWGLMTLLLCSVYTAEAVVSVMPASGGTGICSNKAVTGSAPAFTALGLIVITEGLNSDFSIGTNTLVLYPPAGWQFSTTLPTLTYITGSNITGVSGAVTASALTVNVTVSAITGADQFTINGLQVQPLTTGAAGGVIRASSVSGIAGIVTGAAGTAFATLSVSAPATASVSIAASPSGAFCPGTNVVFTPTATNGGTPTFTWALNGVDVSIGATYSNNSLTSGNTVSCRMNSSLGCLTANPVFSNTITASVLPAPGAITGSSAVCPGNTITLGNSTGGGIWISSNPAKGAISSSGVVTGIAAGTTTVSYIVGGCAATKTIFINDHPFPPAVSPVSATICDGTTLTVSVSGTPASPNILSQNFNSGLGAWVVDTTGSINILPGAEWKACADSYLNEQGWYRSPDHSTFIMANADTSGSLSTLVTKLTSPSFSLADYSSATLSFQHAYDYWPAGDVYVNLEISTDGGATWNTINNYRGANIGTKMGFVSQSVSLNAYLGNPNVKIRFYYHSAFGYYWALDNIVITGTPGYVVPVWSPVTWLYMDASHTIPYVAGTQASTVYVHPSSVSVPTPVTYTVTAASGTCAGVAHSTVTVNPLPGAMSGTLNLCVGTTTTLSNTAAGGTWVSGNAAIATVDASGVVSGVAAGTANISYVLGSSCSSVVTVTVNITPAPIDGNRNVCLGYTSALSDVTTGGVWSSDNSAVAPVNITTGEVSGLSLGTANITYSLGAGCSATATVTVQPLPAPVTGPSVVCATQSITLSTISGGGTWVSGNTAIATVNPSTGEVTGVAAGNTGISYAFTTTGCFSYRLVTVNALAPIDGPGNVCVGHDISLLNSVAGGTWSSASPGIATINASSGFLSGIAPGVTAIAYVLPSGCTANRNITVNPVPTDITGPTSVCAGSTITLSNTVPGGTWSSSNANASVSSGGVVSGLLAGSATITYTVAEGCYKTHNITVQPLPAAITGGATVCVSGATSLSCVSAGGIWSSSNTSIATVAGGAVSGITAGTAIISYTVLSTGCSSVRVVTVNPLPSAILGSLSLCHGATSVLTCAAPGGSWLSSNSAVATIGSTSGIVNGVAVGTAFVTYTLPTGCRTTSVVTVNTLPGTISGPSIACTGASVTLSSGVAGGTWSSSNTAVATVAAGVVSGHTVGLVNITYTLSTGCLSVKTMTVYPSPASVTGVTDVCDGLSTTLSSLTSGGGWTSGNTSIATVTPSSGIVTGITPGTTIITYMVASGCTSLATVNVLPLPAPVTGDFSICPGTSSTLASASSGGTWSSSLSLVATVGSSSGIVTGALTGTATISYTLPTGCYSTATILVNPPPSSVIGASSVCVGSVTTFTSATSGGTWVSVNPSIATVGSTTGQVTGISDGITTISYVLPTGCASSKNITVNPLPSPVSGPANICQSSAYTFTATPSGGTWNSSTPGIAYIGASSGILTGASAGAVAVSYTLGTGCRTSMLVSVTALPAALTGSSAVCVGGSVLYTSTTGGGTWSSENPTIASVSASGVVSGLTAGTSVITYTIPPGCYTVKAVTVNPLPSPLTGSTSLCIGTPSPLSSAPSGGGWISSNATIASVTTAGVVTGHVQNTARISYILPTGCIASTTVTVNLTPSAIVGSGNLCVGVPATFSNPVTGGTWSSSQPSVASVSLSGGVVSPVSAGTAHITYTLSTGCYVTKLVTVYPLPAAVSGVPALCAGSTATFTNATTGGTWSSSNSTVASAGSATGIVAGLSAGTAYISYTLPSGCATTYLVTVHPLPSGITGPGTVCLGSTSVLSSASPGGTWSSSVPSVASVGPGGVVSGISLGTTRITYTLAAGCYVTRLVTVSPLPAAITGPLTSCPGVGFTLSCATAGGAWSSGTSGIITINATTGAVTSIAAGTALVTYTMPTGCSVSETVTINAVPDITGPSGICAGAATSFTHTTSGGTWSSSSSLIVGINPSSGIAVGFAAGTATISYTMPTGCIASKTITVAPAPSAITGTASVCPGASVTLFSATSGGTWSSGNVLVATIGATSGIMTGVAPGIASVYYTLPSGCAVSRTITVNAIPATISGSTSLCAGTTATYTIAATGGTWYSSATGIATIGATTGILTASAAGTTTVSYSVGSGCPSVMTVTVNTVPPAITGAGSVCNGFDVTLSNSLSGGLWSSTATSVATIDASSGLLTSLSPGTTVISYTTVAGCAATRIFSVNVQPAPIDGAPSVCVGYTTALSSSPAGGTWYSGSLGIASVTATGGLVSGISSGTAVISYRMASGCQSAATVTVSPVPSAVSGPSSLCVGSTAVFSDPALGGGTWSSSNAAVASVDVASGSVTAVSAGTCTITYMIGSGCFITVPLSIMPVPAPITGIASVCTGMTTTLNCTTPGGSWVSSVMMHATVGSTTGLVTGSLPGSTEVSYVLPSGCSASVTVTVNPLPGPVSGVSGVCQESVVLLDNSVSGGTWASSLPSVGTIDALSGMFTGVSAGITDITYTVGAGCYATRSLSVHPLPASIAGSSTVCEGQSISLSSATSGGIWTASGVAAISSSGVLTGTTAGTASVSYTIPGTGCTTIKLVTVHPLAANAGSPVTCPGFSVTLTNPNPGGIWSSGNAAVATVSGSGVVTGVMPGTATISYTLSSGCVAATVVTVNGLSANIGPAAACIGEAVTYANAAPGGTWTSSDMSVATIDAAGNVAALNAGTSIISYTYGAGCVATSLVTVHPVSPVGGSSAVCVGLSASLSTPISGGSWSSLSPLVSVNTVTGSITGLSAGTAVVSYTLPTGCATTATVTVHPLADITGTASVCGTSSVTLSNVVPGGTWSSAVPSVASVNVLSGVVTGVTTGTAAISYHLPTGCSAGRVVTVFATPAPVTGTLRFCQGQSVTLASATPGGSWSLSHPATAGIDPLTGTVTGLAAGTAIVSYIMPSGCSAVATVTVDAAPPAITGTTAVCQGAGAILANAMPSGSWSSSDISVAAIGTSSGAVTALIAGTSVISYTLPSGCATGVVLTVNSLPTPVSGSSLLCVGYSLTLSSSPSGGSWSSSSAVAGVSPGFGIVTGLSAGTAVITYTLGTGCRQTKIVTVQAPPATISGPSQVCVGSSAMFSSATSGGVWVSSATTIASVDAVSGLVTGIAPGTAVISYSLSSGCNALFTVSVAPLPAAISGTSVVCEGSTASLTNATSGGSWSSAATAVASVSASGVVSGIAAGTALISYTLPTGCATTATVTVHPLPASLSGSFALCAGASTHIVSSPASGTWSSDMPAVASVDAVSGLVSAVTPGTAGITYTLSTGCAVRRIVTVHLTPAPVSGPSVVCAGSTILLSDMTPGGVWTSLAAPIATVSSSGLVSGIAAGNTTISYTLPSTGCGVAFHLTVNPVPASISGIVPLCPGTATALSSADAGGSWSVSAPVAVIDATTGIATGVSSGTATVTYMFTTGCYTTGALIVNPLPGAIVGSSAICEGAASIYSCTPSGGSWSSSASGIAAIHPSSGLVTGISSGTVSVSYTLPTGCRTIRSVTVNPLPDVISGDTVACIGLPMHLLNAVPGGTWSGSATSVATVGSSSGIVTGVSAGTVTVSYTLPTGCGVATALTVHPVPAPVTGPSVLCQGSSVLLSCATVGGSWQSGTPLVGTISTAGIFTGIDAGVAAVSYILPTGCSAISYLTVNPSLPVTGPSSVCAGDSVNLYNGVPGGTWSSSAPAVAAISSTGRLYGNISGTAVITYALPSGCYSTHPVNVNPWPIAYYVTGGGVFCEGGAGVPIGLTGSMSGFVYKLYNGTTEVLSVPGTGTAFSFGIYSVAGTYTAISVNPVTGCRRAMALDATVSPTPYGPPSVSVIPDADTVCAGTPVHFSPIPVGGGAAPAYLWFVNGSLAGLDTSYTYIPSSGDVVTCRLSSSSPCAVPATAEASASVSVLPLVNPSVSIVATPGTVLCAGVPVSFTYTSMYGGAAPVYLWQVNGAVIGSGASYSYTPSDNDIVACRMVSDERCPVSDTVISNIITMDVNPQLIPAVTVNAAPGFNVVPGTSITFSVTAVNAGSVPSYQWKINGTAITGATSAVFVWSVFAGGEEVSCEVTSHGDCGGYTTSDAGIVSFSTGVSVTGAHSEVWSMFPNPSNGTFTVSGDAGNTGFVHITVTDVPGREVYHTQVSAVNNHVRQTISLGGELANGIYLVTVKGADGNIAVFHLMLQR